MIHVSTTHVATLISSPGTPALDGTVLAEARDLLPRSGAPRWLDPGLAADIPFSPERGNDKRAVLERLRGAVAGRPVDVVVQRATPRRKRLLVADMDSTMIGQECIDELADLVGLRDHVAAITERAMRGDITFEPALRERVALLEGLPVSAIGDLINTRIQLTAGGPTLVRTMRANGSYCCLVSGGFTLFTDRIGAAIGFNENRANRLVITDGVLKGLVEEPVLGPGAKLATLLELRLRLHLQPVDTLAIGDGANDLAMLQAAGLGVAFHAKPRIAATVEARIDHGDLTAMLYLQGYCRDEFIEA